MTAMRAVALLVGWLWAGAAAADTLVLGIPVDCPIGDVCSVQNYADIDPGPGRRDHACGLLTYDGHKGTDFRVRDLADMERGVAVVAAAAGTVRATRDGMPDVSIRTAGSEAIAGREAGNAVVIDHGDGWETQYSHMRQGSVAVRPGDRVTTGQRLGLIGLSGNTEFPHLDLVVRRDGQAMEPFLGTPLDAGPSSPTCATGERPQGTPLWSAAAQARLAYRPTGPLNAGFSIEAPNADQARQGAYATARFTRAAPLLAFWAELFGAQPKDRLRLRILDPAGRPIHDSSGEVPKAFASLFVNGTAPRPPGGWSPGVYRGAYSLSRDGRTVLEVTRDIRLDD